MEIVSNFRTLATKTDVTERYGKTRKGTRPDPIAETRPGRAPSPHRTSPRGVGPESREKSERPKRHPTRLHACKWGPGRGRRIYIIMLRNGRRFVCARTPVTRRAAAADKANSFCFGPPGIFPPCTANIFYVCLPIVFPHLLAGRRAV